VAGGSLGEGRGGGGYRGKVGGKKKSTSGELVGRRRLATSEGGAMAASMEQIKGVVPRKG